MCSQPIRGMPNQRPISGQASGVPLPFGGAALRGQIYVIDFVVSMSIFMLLVAVAYTSWASGVERAGEGLEGRLAADSAWFVLSSVIDSPGVPSNWAANATDTRDEWLAGIGCAEAQGRLDPARLAAANYFFNSSYYHNSSRWKMGFGQFEGDLRIMRPDGTALYVFGTPPNSSVIVLSSATRSGLLEGNPVFVRVRVWKGVYQ